MSGSTRKIYFTLPTEISIFEVYKYNKNLYQISHFVYVPFSYGQIYIVLKLLVIMKIMSKKENILSQNAADVLVVKMGSIREEAKQ